MNPYQFDKAEYKNIVLFTMKDNNGDQFPVHIRKVTPQDGLSPLHRHEAVQINYINRGHIWHEINKSRYELVKGDIFVMPPFVPHQLLPGSNPDFEIIELEFRPEFIFLNAGFSENINNFSSLFDFSYIEPFLVAECNVRPHLNLSGDRQMQIEALLEEIYTEYTTRPEGYLLALRADLLKLLVQLGRCFRQDSEDNNTTQIYNHHREAMEKAIRYVNEHYADPLSIESVARIAMLSLSYFSYLFKAITGKTVVEYINDLRIRKALQLLQETNDLVVDICFNTGFKNVSHFNRTFKNQVGISPTQYRKAYRKGSLSNAPTTSS